MSKKVTDPRNKHRGTKLSQYRFGPDTLAALDSIVAHQSAAADGAKVSRADVLRRLIEREAERLKK